MFKVAVDVGRSSVKFAYKDKVRSFPFLLSRGKKVDANETLYHRDLEWGWVDGEEILFGETARLMGSSIIQHTEGKEYMIASCQSTLFAVAQACLDSRHNSIDVVLAINLTFKNMFMKEQYAKLLAGKHVIKMYTGDVVSFTILDKIQILPQGFSGFLAYAMDKNLQVKTEFQSSEGVIVDIGRRTIDFVYIDNLIVKEGKSEDFGTFNIFKRAGEYLQAQHSIIKEPYEVERYYIDNKRIRLTNGKQVDIKPLIDRAVGEHAQSFGDLFASFMGASHTPDFIFLIGGGAFLYGGYFKGKYDMVVIPSSPHTSNVEGLLKYINRIGG
jgi:Actin like proteins N terminal domain/Archaeal actin homologue MreB-like, C-terminal